MSSFALRVFAFLSMTADNAGLAVFPQQEFFRAIGRIAFPLYCFLLSEGFAHTRSRQRYALRLFLLALVCEMPFDLLHFGKPFEPVMQNACWSLLLCLGMLGLCESNGGMMPRLCILAGACLLSMLMNLSFGWLGPVLCFAFRSLRGDRFGQAAAAFFLPFLYSLHLFFAGVGTEWILLSLAAPVSAVPVYFYSGHPGPKGKGWTLLFYASVPAMLVFLLLLRQCRLIPPWML